MDWRMGDTKGSVRRVADKTAKVMGVGFGFGSGTKKANTTYRCPSLSLCLVSCPFFRTLCLLTTSNPFHQQS